MASHVLSLNLCVLPLEVGELFREGGVLHLEEETALHK